MLKLESWNVNGIRAAVKHGFMDIFNQLDADIFCIQETKLQAGQIELELPGYYQFWNYADKKGYSGTAIFTKYQPKRVSNGIGSPQFDDEGRVITLEYEKVFIVTSYTPNSQPKLKRLGYRRLWNDAFLAYINQLKAVKPVIFCGDLNVAHQEIDLKHPDHHHLSSGFSNEERADFSELLKSGYVDTFRYLHADKLDAYTWWDYRFHARNTNAGWRIDYFVVSENLAPHIVEANILDEVYGSDHAPVELKIELDLN